MLIFIPNRLFSSPSRRFNLRNRLFNSPNNLPYSHSKLFNISIKEVIIRKALAFIQLLQAHITLRIKTSLGAPGLDMDLFLLAQILMSRMRRTRTVEVGGVLGLQALLYLLPPFLRLEVIQDIFLTRALAALRHEGNPIAGIHPDPRIRNTGEVTARRQGIRNIENVVASHKCGKKGSSQFSVKCSSWTHIPVHQINCSMTSRSTAILCAMLSIVRALSVCQLVLSKKWVAG